MYVHFILINGAHYANLIVLNGLNHLAWGRVLKDSEFRQEHHHISSPPQSEPYHTKELPKVPINYQGKADRTHPYTQPCMCFHISRHFIV